MGFRKSLVLMAITATVATAFPATAAAAPPAPTNVRAFSITGTSATLEWNTSSGASEYEVRWTGSSKVVGATIPNAVISGLSPSTSYTFRVRAKGSSGTSPDSAPFTLTTKSDPGGGNGPVHWGGARSSSYGISPFPSACGWEKATKQMSGYFPGSTPANVWIVGNISNNGVALQFPHPGDGRNYGSRIKFASSDKHEPFLDYFDTHGIKVWLQVESGFADMPTLIDLVLKRYKHHPSVLGFGVDVEWFNPRGADLNDPVTDSLAQQWESRVKSHKSSYTLFLKHFSPASLPKTYRGQIVFVDDTQYFTNVTDYVAEMKGWADLYYPNPVLYQIGYASDRGWWSKEAKPIPQTLSRKLSGVTRQAHGFAWVDFTLRDVLSTSC
ncbi:fibronectin type III domain-containing protein [Kibdelosporangium aridum]|uniref:Fibronectin type III domain-containing protein n=1 Tax=Kibdelosporangium aridum TaxID=2030 RepID=A0A1W2FBN5_KIBAR|nr:fibronectin type III domain-containing protein [Kibdelosporangium aridum]SMD18956.1 Fibronectin type III domain-containing protein [Kibdelosporangium aridum]